MLGVTPLRSLEHRPSLVVVCDVFARVHCDQCWAEYTNSPFFVQNTIVFAVSRAWLIEGSTKDDDDDDWGFRARGMQWSFCAHVARRGTNDIYDWWSNSVSVLAARRGSEKCTVKYNRIFRNTTGCYPRLGIRDVDVLWRWPSILGSPVNDRCVPAAAVTWQALIGGPAQLAGVLAWLLCHGRQSASVYCWRSSRKPALPPQIVQCHPFSVRGCCLYVLHAPHLYLKIFFYRGFSPPILWFSPKKGFPH